MAYVAPDLTTALAAATAANSWTQDQAKEAKKWLEIYFQVVYQAPAGTTIRVMNKKSDDLWHEFLNDPNYATWSKSVFNNTVLQHVETPPRHKPTKAEEDADKPYYGANWPVPDSIVSCHS